MSSIRKFLSSKTVQMVIATIGGIIFGLLLGKNASNIKFIGDIFIRLIQMSIVVLVMTSIISAIGNLKNNENDSKSGMKMGFNTFKWILVFTFLAAILGIVLSYLLKPGNDMVATSQIGKVKVESLGFRETLKNFVPTNIFESMSKGDMIPVIVFSILFGAGLNIFLKDNENTTTMVFSFIKELNTIILNVIQLVMRIAPVGVFCLLASVVGTTGPEVMISMIKYLGSLLIGTVVILVTMSLIVAIRCKLNPLLMPKKFLEMSIIALTTTSSAVTFPTALKDCIEKFGVKKDIANFTMSVGMTMGSAGAAMNYVVMIFFMQQSAGVELPLMKILIGIGLSILLTLGTITVPGSAAVVATFLASSLGLPLESISLLIGVDWFAGMFRTIVNVNNDVFVSLLVANNLDAIDRETYENN